MRTDRPAEWEGVGQEVSFWQLNAASSAGSGGSRLAALGDGVSGT